MAFGPTFIKPCKANLRNLNLQLTNLERKSVNDLNAAQRIRQLMGLPVAAYQSLPRNASFTKRGPGRRHQQGKAKKP